MQSDVIATLGIRRLNAPEEQRMLTHERITFGRALDNDVASPSDRHLSRHHFAIEPVENSCVVRDLNSRNGTFVNGQRITVRELHTGDRITAGGFSVEVDIVAAAASQTTELHTVTTLDAALQSDLVPQNRDAERHVRALVEAARVLASSDPATNIWDKLLAITTGALGAEHGVIATVDSNGDWICVTGGSFDISDSVRKRIVNERVSLLVRDVAADAPLKDSPSLILQDVRTLMAAPLQTENEVLGLIYVVRTALPEFTILELNLLTILANMAALRVGEARAARIADQERERALELEQSAAAKQRALEAAELMRYAEARAILAETAASMTRLAAAISHELNTPLGALTSSVDILLRSIARGLQEGDPAPFFSLAPDLCSAIRASTARLSDIVRTLQRFTNLDRAETQVIELAHFLKEVGAATRVEDGGVTEVDQTVDQTLVSYPQQLACVFSALLERCHGIVHLSAAPAGRGTAVTLHAKELVLTEEDMMSLFDPTFRVTAGRIAASNWSLCSARQIMRELGGDIQVDTHTVRGTVFTVLIPNASA